MKGFYALFLVLVLGSLLAACSASTANITSADLGTGYDSSATKVTGATTTFDKTAPEIHTVVSVANAPSDTAVRATLTAVDVTDMNGQNIKDKQVLDNPYTIQSDATIDFKFTVPATGEWPVGKYKVDIYLNDKLDRTLNFTVQ
jgi:hypothetical protein